MQPGTSIYQSSIFNNMAESNDGLSCNINSSKDMTFDDFKEISNAFASEFNSSDLSDRVLCFQFIEADEINDDGESKRGSELTEFTGHVYTAEYTVETLKNESIVTKFEEGGDAMEDIKEDIREPQNKKQRLEPREIAGRNQIEREAERSDEGTASVSEQSSDQPWNENKPMSNKLFVHSQWLAVQSPYFKALFYSGMKETFSKEVVMKIYEHELPAHLTLIEAMYKLDALSGKDFHLVSKVLVLAHKYDVRHVIKKCKYVLLSSKPSLEMCEYILQEISHLDDMTEIYDMLEKFLVEEFTPIDKTWTMEKLTQLSEAALKLLLGSDSLATRSENTIFVALMKWVQMNIPEQARNKCDLLTVVRFECMSVNFLYDVVKNHLVAREMPEFTEYLLRGLAYHGFSQIRRDQLDLKPKQRPVLPKDDEPTFSWVIDDELLEKLSDLPGDPVYSDEFWYQGYEIRLKLSFKEYSSECSFHLNILNLGVKACLNVSYRAESILFVSRVVRSKKRLYKSSGSSWGFGSIEHEPVEMGKSFTIYVWVDIVE